MTDYRNPNDPFYRDDQLNRNAAYDASTRGSNATWGWIAGALFLVVILAIAFGIGHEPTMVATNEAAPPPSPPAVTRMAPNPNPAPSAVPAPAPSPANPAPATPAER